MIIDICQVNVPDQERAFDYCSYNAKNDSLETLNSEEFEKFITEYEEETESILAPTSNLHLASTIIDPWLTNRDHILLVGPEASGKRCV